MITRRKPSEKFLENAQIAGMILLLLLLIFANGNDLLRWLGK
jgi:regulator of sigma E protease